MSLYANSGALAVLKMFYPAMIKFCAMRTLNLGYSLWLLGSVLTVLLKDFDVFGGHDVADTLKLQRAWNQLNDWCRERKIS